MSIPDYQSLMLPLLTLAADGGEHSIRDARERLAAELRLTDAERSELLPSGRQPVFDNRVAWAKTYLQRAGLLHFPSRAHFQTHESDACNSSRKEPKLNDEAKERLRIRKVLDPFLYIYGE